MSTRYPTPDRSGLLKEGEPGIEPGTRCLELGWATGTFADSRPWRAEEWSERLGDQRLLAVTVFFSVVDLEAADQEALADLLQREGLVRFQAARPAVQATRFRDRSDRPMWSLTVVLRLIDPDAEADEVHATTPLRFRPYPHQPPRPGGASSKPRLPG